MLKLNLSQDISGIQQTMKYNIKEGTMATKPNMYRGLRKEAEEIIEKINDGIQIYSMQEDRFKEIIGYDTDQKELIRDDVAIMQGKLELALKGLDKNSPKRDAYEEMLRYCVHFMEFIKQLN